MKRSKGDVETCPCWGGQEYQRGPSCPEVRDRRRYSCCNPRYLWPHVSRGTVLLCGGNCAALHGHIAPQIRHSRWDCTGWPNTHTDRIDGDMSGHTMLHLAAFCAPFYPQLLFTSLRRKEGSSPPHKEACFSLGFTSLFGNGNSHFSDKYAWQAVLTVLYW